MAGTLIRAAVSTGPTLKRPVQDTREMLLHIRTVAR
jgi:hypothetical protein